jgi:hypothetical protein
MPCQLRIAIDPALTAWRPEIVWAWRTLLSGMGYAWVERPLDAALDIAYTPEPARAPQARLLVCADATRWSQPANYVLHAVADACGWPQPRFAGENAGAALLSVHEGQAILERDVVFDTFWLLSGQGEQPYPKHAHGYVDLTDAPLLTTGALRRALASAAGAGLERLLRDLGCPLPLARWPHGKTMAATCGHDVDYPELVRWLEPLRIVRRQKARGLRPALAVALGQHSHWHFRSWMELEQQLGARSAFYFVARQGSLREYAAGLPDPFYDVRAPHFRALFAELAEQGFEIGLHTSYLAYTNRAKFAAERATLAEASGQPVLGNRHHYWHLDPDDPEATLLMHEQIGLLYDASLTHDRYLGWRRGTTWPFYPWHRGLRRPLRTLQLPTGWMDDHLFGHHAHNPGERHALLRELAACTAEQGGLLMVDVHEYVFDATLFPGWADAYRVLWEALAARADVWFATPGEIASFWADRATTLERASRGLDGSE